MHGHINMMDEDEGSVTPRVEFYDNSNNFSTSGVNHTISSQWESSYSPQLRDDMRRKLKFWFMNPLDKWKAKGKFPWKLLLQLIKIIFVTIQIVMFGSDMSRFYNHVGNTVVTFRELLLIKWDPVREVMAYPPSAGPYAVYSKADFYDSVDFAIKNFSNITDSAIGTFGYSNSTPEKPMSVIKFCKEYYANGIADPSNYFYNYTNQIVYSCISIDNLFPPGDPKWQTNFNIQSYLDDYNFTINFDRMLKVDLKFYLRTIYLNSLAYSDAPECYNFDITITYDNTQHDGQVLVQMLDQVRKHTCDGNLNDYADDRFSYYERLFVNILVIGLCLTSFFLCLRSVIKAQQLRRETSVFFERYYDQRFSFTEQFDFVDLWIILMILNDVLVIVGSIFKIRMEERVTMNDNYSLCSILLGIGNLMVWVGILRYLSFFKNYNIVMLTLKTAFPHVLRFLLCALILYGGFCFCGWVVLGPYHIKFRNLSTASECLFSLLNGDDMFATFATLNTNNNLIWWFTRIYLYLFVALFIYVVLSLFISIIMDSYETIKECMYGNSEFPMTPLQKFIAEGDDTISTMFQNENLEESRCLCSRDCLVSCFSSCKQKLRRQHASSYEGID